MIQAAIDKPMNLLTIVYAGRVSAQETRNQLPDLQKLLEWLTPGFCLLTDMTELESMDLQCAPDIEQMMHLCDQRGVEAIIRVIPDPQKDIGMNIMSRFHYGREVRIVTCETMREALEVLEGLPRKRPKPSA